MSIVCSMALWTCVYVELLQQGHPCIRDYRKLGRAYIGDSHPTSSSSLWMVHPLSLQIISHFGHQDLVSRECMQYTLEDSK